MTRPVVDVSRLPDHAFGHRGLVWWGTVGMIAIEGTVFAMALASYAYLQGMALDWPLGALPPDLGPGTLNVALMLLSAIPNQLTKRAAMRHDAAAVRRWILTTVAAGVVLLAVRVAELGGLNVRWDSNAYGSVVWTIMGLHTFHLLTDWVDTTVLGVLFVAGPIESRRFVDAADNSGYWYFVVLSWLPIYAVVYLLPRL